MRFRPCIDLHEGKVKQIIGSTLRDSEGIGPRENFVSEKPPSYYAELFKRDGLRGGHVIMLGPGNEASALEALSAWPGGMQIGGGITDGNASYWLDAGAEAVIVTSFCFSNGKFHEENLKKLISGIGKERLVLDLSCRKREDGNYYVVTDRWQRFTELKVDAKTLEYLGGFCLEFLVHGVDVEGKCAGIERELVEILGKYSPIPTTYAGGIRSIKDIQEIEEIGRGRIDFTVGSALDIFGGKFLKYHDLVRQFGPSKI
ncbi:Phosphoribosylformimino-5-aminoimidazole carboxamide ribotide isomerase [Dissulfuribacter thermophilus]|uniref:Phosphoribosylformimino-5-aminoimidazole carboxamide ribotide isomerase n=1 Tax=Dissulfuribacter thermophilus TaxID=1156395 RepID=A0A1B9F7A5_9BACT|nr:phosphoribosylformimino-5-aminoimidazole carboxamide ribotide isomerase [Dissulfuribacter thermophilus]OCC15838.1 Phosphoribosylformimino-5-aminoimidazole carboxamide ribotide isomerase [Dissulfuribacter thermophilus]